MHKRKRLPTFKSGPLGLCTKANLARLFRIGSLLLFTFLFFSTTIAFYSLPFKQLFYGCVSLVVITLLLGIYNVTQEVIYIKSKNDTIEFDPLEVELVEKKTPSQKPGHALSNFKEKRKRLLALAFIILCILANFSFFWAFLYLPFRTVFNPRNGLQTSIVGSVGQDFAILWARAPGRESTVQFQFKSKESSDWEFTSSIVVTKETDFTTSIQIEGLEPLTSYEAQLLIDGKIDENSLSFKTFQRKDSPLYLGEAKQHYEAKYREVFADSDFQSLFQTTPVFMMYDDHEIINNFDAGKTNMYEQGISAWKEYGAIHNPPSLREDEFYYSFQNGEVDFFVLDTRRHRTPNAESDDKATMLGEKQLGDLFNWLNTSSATLKFIVSTVIFTTDSQNNDGWSSRLIERDKILDFIENHHISGVSILSGDKHWCGAFELREGLFEFEASPISAFLGYVDIENTNERVLFTYDKTRAHGHIKVFTEDDPAYFEVYFYGEDEIVYSEKFTLQPNGRFVESSL